MTACRLLSIAVALFAIACERETRDLRPLPPGNDTAQVTRLTDFQAGAPSPPPNVPSPYRENAWALGEGKRLYAWFNCVGCHHEGGGGIGPALMDHRWIYGSRPDQIFSTIVQGRPNGMPAFAGKIPDQQVWQLVAYVESLSGNVPKDAAPGRNDDLSASEPEMRRERVAPKQTGHR